MIQLLIRGSAAAPCGKPLAFRLTAFQLIARLRLAPEAQPQRNQKQPRKGTALPHCPAAQPQRHRAAQEQPRGKIAKERARRPRSQQAVEGLRTINDYSREELVTALLRGMGKKWWTRDDAIRAAARRLGFTRTGRQIRDAFKSAINGAIRRGLLEYDGDIVRRPQ